jgi:hypothetical protein
VILRCTIKLQAIVGRPDPLAASLPAEANDWYANVLWLDRRKCLLVTHAGTLFSVFVPDVRASQLRPPGPFVIPRVLEQLAAEGLPSRAFGVSEDFSVIVAKTADRSVLGCMNDLAMLCEHVVADAGGLMRLNLADLHRAMHRNINFSLDYVPAIDLANDWATRLP